MKVRVKYEKGDPVRFLSHLDVARVIHIAAGRARWPMEMSQGYSPKPKFSFYAPLPAGTAGREEYFDAALVRDPGLEELARSLARSLPFGFGLWEIRKAPDREEPFEDKFVASDYSLDIKRIDMAKLSRCMDAFMAETQMPFLVVRPKESKTVDLRPFVLRAGDFAEAEGDRVVFNMTILHKAGRTIRPQWVLSSLSRYGLDLDPREVIVDRRKILFG